MSYIYLASPYTAAQDETMEDRFCEAERCLAWLLDRKHWTYSPIVHCHALAKRFILPRDYAFWREYNYCMMTKANSLYVLTIDGWEESRGVQQEIAFAETLNLHTSFILPQSDDGYIVRRAT
jgi:Domain of unknown function (DUF1937)